MVEKMAGTSNSAESDCGCRVGRLGRTSVMIVVSLSVSSSTLKREKLGRIVLAVLSDEELR